jgi:ankyrin repeat protein
MKKSVLLIAAIIIMIQCNVSMGKVPEVIKVAKKGDLARVQQLIESGVDINATDRRNLTALMWASSNGNIEIARLLIEKGADVNAHSGWTALIWAAAKGQTDVVKLLLEKGADINAVNSAGCTALMLAAYLGRTETAKLLIDNGAKLNVKSNYGVTALMMARQKMVVKGDKRMDIAGMLEAAGAKE